MASTDLQWLPAQSECSPNRHSRPGTKISCTVGSASGAAICCCWPAGASASDAAATAPVIAQATHRCLSVLRYAVLTIALCPARRISPEVQAAAMLNSAGRVCFWIIPAFWRSSPPRAHFCSMRGGLTFEEQRQVEHGWISKNFKCP